MKRITVNILLLFWSTLSLQSQIITTITGIPGSPGYSGDGGPAAAAKIYYPYGLTTDNAGNLYIADMGNYVVRKISTTGIISTIAGNGTYGNSGDGGPATAAQIGQVSDVAVDNTGNVYIVDYTNGLIRKVNTAGIISTIAGTPGSTGFSGDGGPATAALLYRPVCIAVDNAANVYITDAAVRIRKINSAGIINTVAGSGLLGYSGDGGPATAARFTQALGLAVDHAGNIYITDTYYHVIRKVNAAGIISTFAGSGTQGFSGDGGPAVSAQLGQPQGVATDHAGNIYIADYNNSVIRKVDASGIISTIAGNGTRGISGDGGLATLAELWFPIGIAADNNGVVYVTDTYDNTVRKIDKCLAIPVITQQPGNGNVCNTGTTTFTITATNAGSYHWQVYNGSTWNDLADDTIYSGSDTNTLVLNKVPLSLNNEQYRCIVDNSCGSVPSAVATLSVFPQPVLTLNPDTTITSGASLQLNASASINIATWEWTPDAELNNPAIPNPIASPTASNTWNLRAISSDGCEADGKVTVLLFKKLSMPNAFTPNADGNNDVFRIPPGVTLTLESFSVYDRWGNRVFSTRNIDEGWDGTRHGSPADIGTYVYIIKGISGGKTISSKGTVHLLR